MRYWNLVAVALANVCVGSNSIAQTPPSNAPQPVTNFTWRAPASETRGPAIMTVDQSATVENGLRATSNSLPLAAALRPNQDSRWWVANRQEPTDPALQDRQSSVSDQVDIPEKQDPVKSAAPVAEDLAPGPLPDSARASTIIAAPETNLPSLVQQPALSVFDQGDSIATNYCNRDCRNSSCNLGCEKKLFGTNCNGLEIGGWTSLGYHNRNILPFNDRKAEANLHQQWLYFDKQAGVTSNWGYRADVLYGIDAQNTQAFGNGPTGAPTGWDNSWDYGSYGFALPQLYLQYNSNLWDVKVGKFFSPFGYEVVAAPQNFFYSHSYTMNFIQPFTMTGVLGERQMTDTSSAILGVTSGWNTGFDRNDGGFNLITGLRRQLNDSMRLALTSSIGDTGVRDSGIMNSGVLQMKLTDTVDYVFQADVLNLQDNNEFGFVQYLFREVSPCLKLGTRLEWWKSDQLFTDTKSTYEFTLGANYRANANLTLRPELRFDWGAAAIDPGTPIVGIDAVLTY